MADALCARSFSTIGDLIDDGWALWFSCPTGCPDRKADLGVLAARYGRDASYLRAETPIRVKCARCGASCRHMVISHG